jgi:hypothetical protein
MSRHSKDIPDDVPQAYSVSAFFCDEPECRRPHVMLFDKDHRPMAHFVIPDPRPDGGGFFQELKNLMYRSAVERGDK